MKKLMLAVCLYRLFTLSLHAQSDIRMWAVQNTIDAYNTQDFKKMKKPWGLLGKTLLTRKSLKREFAPTFQRYGKARIDTVTYFSKYEYTAQLRYEKDASKRTFMNFLFTEKGKIEGMGAGSPTFIYRKKNEPAISDPLAQKQKIDALIKTKYLKPDDSGFNGCVLALDHDKVVYKDCFGYRDFHKQLTINDSSLIELASCSKQFTAMAIMMLAEQGKLNYSDSLRKFIPDFPYSGMTIEHLLTHTSGMPDYNELFRKRWDKTRFATNRDIVTMLQQYKPKPLFSPGERFEYSNTGYAMLSLVIEAVSGMSYPDFLKTHIFTPLGMKNTRVYNTRRVRQEVIDNYAYGYVRDKKTGAFVLPDSLPEYDVVTYTDAITGDGTVNSSISDLVLWENALRRNALVSKLTLDKAYSTYHLNNGEATHYGYAEFLQGEPGGERVVYHTGGWPGYLCIILRFVDQEKTVIVLSNNSYDNFAALADGIGAILIGDE